MATITIKSVSLSETHVAVSAEFNDTTVPLTWVEKLSFSRDEVAGVTSIAEFRDVVAIPKFQTILEKYKKLKVASGWLESKLNQAVTL